MEIGDRSGQTFNRLWQRIKKWNSRKYFSDRVRRSTPGSPPKLSGERMTDIASMLFIFRLLNIGVGECVML